MKIIPHGARVFVKREEPAKTSPSGRILLPENAQKEKPKRGTVIAVGEGRTLDNGLHIPVQVHEGQEVLFAHFAGNDVVVDDEEYLALHEDDILAYLE
jgi:chaperonin GroES